MTFDEFQQFIDDQDALFHTVREGQSDREHIFARTIKLGEEYGELCDEVLASMGHQRKDKLAEHHDLAGEFADVVIVAFLLAKAMNVNVREALAKKIQKIKDKHNKQL